MRRDSRSGDEGEVISWKHSNKEDREWAGASKMGTRRYEVCPEDGSVRSVKCGWVEDWRSWDGRQWKG
jgi:hypothetical protein